MRARTLFMSTPPLVTVRACCHTLAFARWSAISPSAMGANCFASSIFCLLPVPAASACRARLNALRCCAFTSATAWSRLPMRRVKACPRSVFCASYERQSPAIFSFCASMFALSAWLSIAMTGFSPPCLRRPIPSWDSATPTSARPFCPMPMCL